MKIRPPTPKSTVYISDLLRRRHRKLVQNLEGVLGRHGVELREVSGTADIWARDYLPIQRHDGVFVSYTYRPDYLKGYSHLVTDWKAVRGLPEGWQVEDARLVLDGGNVVLRARAAIVTEKIFAENPDLSPGQVRSRLRDAFRLASLVTIPVEPGDVLGHADGMIAWAGPHRVLVNDYRRSHPSLYRAIVTRLHKAGLEPIPVPYAPATSRSSVPPATGVYTNMLALPQVLVVPRYGIRADATAAKRIALHVQSCPLESVSCRTIARLGGSLRCVTAEVTSTGTPA